MKKNNNKNYVVNFFATEIPNYSEIIDLQAKAPCSSPDVYGSK
jgi:hypothetical protein